MHPRGPRTKRLRGHQGASGASATEVRPPRLAGPPRQADEAATGEHREDPLDRSLGLAVDAPGRDHEQPPAVVVDRLPSVQARVPTGAPRSTHRRPSYSTRSPARSARTGRSAGMACTVDVADRARFTSAVRQALEDDGHPQLRLDLRCRLDRVPRRAARAAATPASSDDAQKSTSPAIVQSPRRTTLSPTTTRSTRLSRVASSTNICRGSETRRPRTTTTDADEHDVAADALGSASKRRGRYGDVLELMIRKRNAVHPRRGPMAGERGPVEEAQRRLDPRNGESGVSAATETPRKMCRKREPRSTFGEMPAASASARVNGRRVSSGCTRSGCPVLECP